MTPELHVLDDLLRQCTPASLWCADENIGNFSPGNFCGQIFTNRFDVHEQLQSRFPNTAFNDFDFSAIHQPTEQLVFRIAKEKAVNLHIIRQAFNHLQPGGKLFLLGYKNEGINSLASFITEQFGADIIVHKHKAQLHCLEIICQLQTRKTDDIYAELQLIEKDGVQFFSKPGVFGWNKIDKGSELLMAVFKSHPPANQEAQILDLGSGYGYLSIMARTLGFQHIDATDNNAASIIACQKNFTHHKIEGEVFADNHARHCRKKYDIVLCNPPFHQGFDHNKSMIDLFVTEAHRLLKPNGKAYFVVNQFIGIEKVAHTLFETCEPLDKAEGFKVFLLKK